jgi:hypothetical protein
MRAISPPVVGYVATVLAVIAVASVAVFELNGMTAKAHREWDAEIDLIIAKQQEKKRLAEMAAAKRIDQEALAAQDAGKTVAALTTDSADEDGTQSRGPGGLQRAHSQGGKKSGRRVTQRGQQFIPAAIVTTLPKFAVATTSTLLRLR